LIPKKARELTEKTSEELDLPLDMVKDIISFTWSELRSKKSNVDTGSIYVDNLGTFGVRFNKLNDLISIYEHMHRKHKPRTLQQHMIWRERNTRIEKLNNIKKFMVDEYERRKEIQQTRKSGKNNNRDMEEPGQDTGGHQ